MSVQIYSHGLMFASACTDETCTVAIEVEVNKQMPTGIESNWKIAECKFSTGESNPSPCQDDPARQHYLLSC